MPEKNNVQLVVGPISTNCWICALDENEAAVIDPGDEADKIILTLNKLNLFPKYILLSHGHFDHIAAAPVLKNAFDGKPQIAIHSLDADYLGENAYASHCKSIKSAMGDTSFIDALWPDGKKGLLPADILLEEGDFIGHFTVLHLPGHSMGSAAFWDKDNRVLFSGDTLFEGAYGRTDLTGGNENDMFSSLRRLFKMDPGINVHPGHGRSTTIGRESSRILI